MKRQNRLKVIFSRLANGHLEFHEDLWGMSWCVSELSSGASVLKGESSRTQAFKRAKAKIEGADFAAIMEKMKIELKQRKIKYPLNEHLL